MIVLCTSRHFVEAAKLHFFPFINLLKQTTLNNIAQKSLISDEYLNLLTINCLLDEVEELLTTKLASNTSSKLTYKLSYAHGVVLYKTLLKLALPDEYYISMVRRTWIEQLDQQIIRNNLYELNRPKKGQPPPRTLADFGE